MEFVPVETVKAMVCSCIVKKTTLYVVTGDDKENPCKIFLITVGDNKEQYKVPNRLITGRMPVTSVILLDDGEEVGGSAVDSLMVTVKGSRASGVDKAGDRGNLDIKTSLPVS